MPPLPAHAKVVIVGGGVVGCSVAYHLASLGWSDVVLLERKQLTSGTTWHAAGLIGQLRATANMTKLAKYSAELYAGLEAETGLATGYRRTGSVAIALSQDRFTEFKRQASMAKTFDLPVHVLTPAQCQQLHPLANMGGVVGGLHIPGDGQADPSNIAQALAKGARNRGARIFERVKVTGVSVEHGRAVAVVTDHGAIAADYVVNCAGMWAREIGLLAGVNVPLQACEHFYVVTEPLPNVPRGLPTLRVPDECTYFKEDAGKLMTGFFEPVAKPWAVNGIPDDFEFGTLPDDWDHIMPQLELAMHRVPLLEQHGIKTFFNGPESFTPDDRYLLGEAPNVERFFVAAGFNSIGIQSAGGAGKALAEWMVGGAPPYDLGDVDIRRMFPFQGAKSYLVARTTETLGLLYADHYPYRQYASGRGARHSPIHERLDAAGACFAEGAGWERPGWFLPKAAAERGEKREYRYNWGRQNWFDHSAAEHLAVRSAVGLFDMSPFAKFRVEGRDAEAVLQKLCANDVAAPPGRVVYTQWLNERGGIEADLTVTRLSEMEVLVVTSSTQAVRDFAWLKRHIPGGAHCIATDVTSGEACIAIMGPNARRLLASLTSADLANAAFPFGTAKTIELGMAHARAHRVTYVGELGWELYVAADQARHVFDLLSASGAEHGLRLCGIHAMNSCRMEKAYRHYGHDISDEDHVLEAGLGFAVKTEKPHGRYGDFIGRAAVLAKQQTGLTRRLLQFRLEDPAPMLFHAEPIWRDGRIAGFITSGSYGHHLGAAIGLGYVACDPEEKPEDILASGYELEIACERFAATASLKPLYDPKSERVRM
jgi:heterotetrameric sarcosine oxidase gamma subunit